MSSKEFDVVVFGASGFTGQHVVLELAKAAKAERKKVTWAIAGRSESKLKAVLADIAKTLNDPSVKETPIIVADVNNQSSMAEMCRRARIVINCTGPFRFFGEQVVKHCIEQQADYVDITGEPQFMEKMFLKYHEEAKAKNVLIINACGFDSLAADVGAAYTASLFPSLECVSAIESFLTLHSTHPKGFAGHYTTYECAVHGFGDVKELASIRKQINEKLLPQSSKKMPIVGPRLKINSRPHWDDRINKYVIPFMGSDASVVRRTQRTNYEWKHMAPFQYAAYATISSIWYVIIMVVFGAIFSTLAQFKLGRQILLKYPRLFSFGVFSHEGPSKDQLESTSFTMTFYGKGYQNKPTSASQPMDRLVVTKVAGPEPGYLSCRVFVVQSALCLLEERDHLPYHGGVHTPGAALFGNTKLVDRLKDNGIEFSLVEERNQVLPPPSPLSQ
eukprot:GEZU01010988.1.p1 GENE.GEZU01010988.1~~GEZU01010988.1.p1  ORF type:complete len:455 (-),score=131.82 GEZU01010988.1:745-2082(-)